MLPQLGTNLDIPLTGVITEVRIACGGVQGTVGALVITGVPIAFTFGKDTKDSSPLKLVTEHYSTFESRFMTSGNELPKQPCKFSRWLQESIQVEIGVEDLTITLDPSSNCKSSSACLVAILLARTLSRS